MRRTWSRSRCARGCCDEDIDGVAICGYNYYMGNAVGIRELKDNLSEYVRRTEAGERIAVTAHGRVVAMLVPPDAAARGRRRSRLDQLIDQGLARPAEESGDPFPPGWVGLGLPKGTAAALIDEDRGD